MKEKTIFKNRNWVLLLVAGLSFVALDARAEFRSGRSNRFNQFNQFNQFNPFFINDEFASLRGQGIEFFGDAREVAGFNKILRRGNQTLARLANGEQVSLSVDRNGNLVDRFGRRISDRDPDAARQAQIFFLQNRDKLFQGNQRDAVDRFLFASGGFGDGRMTIDLASFSLPVVPDSAGNIQSDLPPGTNRVKAGLAALNFLLNTIQNRCLVRIFEQQVSGGTVTLDFNTFRDANGNPCFNGVTISLLKTSDEKDRCNQGKIRINEMINTMMNPTNYNIAQGVAGLNRTQISDVLGVAENKLATFGNKLLVGTSLERGDKQSRVVGGDHRVIEVQNTANMPGRTCYRSLDFLDLHEGGAGTDARNVYKSGILFTHEAEEWLCIGANGFLVTFLFNQNGDLLGEAPGSIASSSGLLRPAVRNVASCLDCHASGFLGGRPNLYEEQKNRIQVANQNTVFIGPNGQPLKHGDFFTTNTQYRARAVADSNLFVEAQKRSGSYLPKDGKNGPPVQLIPAAMEARKQVVRPSVMARELGVSESVAKALLGGRESVDRTEFESRFCDYKGAGDSVARSFSQSRSQKPADARKTTPPNSQTHRKLR
ncbi:hypothetical protein EBQ90_01150 [bacterium]|nr:hypothetical protein [bacterium]